MSFNRASGEVIGLCGETLRLFRESKYCLMRRDRFYLPFVNSYSSSFEITAGNGNELPGLLIRCIIENSSHENIYKLCFCSLYVLTPLIICKLF